MASSSSYCFSEEVKQDKLSLDEAIILATNKEMDLIQSRIDIKISKENVKYAKRFQNPKIETEFLTGDTSIGNPQQVGLIIPIEILKRGARKNVAKSQVEESKYDFEANQFNLKIEIRKSYISFAAQKTLLKIVKKQITLFEKNADVVHKKYLSGEVPEVEFLQAKLFSDQTKIAYNNALKNLETEQLKFNQILNLSGDNPLYDIKAEGLLGYGDFAELKTATPEEEILSLREIEELALKNRTDIKKARQEIITAQKKLIYATRQKIPDVNFLCAYQFLTPFQNNDFTISNGGYLQGVMIGGSIDLPVLYRHKPEIQMEKLKLESKIIEYNQTKKQALKNVDIAYREFITAKKNLACYQNTLLLDLDEILGKTKEYYINDKSDISNLILVQQNRLKILNSYIEVLEQYYKCWIELVNQSSTEELIKNN